MATQDDINNLTTEIASEQESARIIDQQVANEQRNSAQKIDAWQQQANRHRDAVARMQQDLKAKQQLLIHEQQQAASESNEEAKHAAERIARGLF